MSSPHETIKLRRDHARPATLVEIATDISDMVFILIEQSGEADAEDHSEIIEELKEEFETIVRWLAEDHGQEFADKLTSRWVYTIG